MEQNTQTYNIFIETYNARFANQLFPLFCALSLYGKYKGKFNTPYFKPHSGVPKYCMELLHQYFNVVSYDTTEFDTNWKNTKPKGIKDNVVTDTANVRYIGYCQNLTLIDEKIVREYIKIPDEVYNKINELYGDLSDYVCVHIRRGDYTHTINSKLYNVLLKEYIERVINKYFPNDKIICISDDIDWCKENLSNNPNILFADKNTGDMSPVIVDFFIQTLTKGNICSGSSFSIGGVLLNPNPNKICIVSDPFFKKHNTFPEINIIPTYAIKEPLNIEKGEA